MESTSNEDVSGLSPGERALLRERLERMRDDLQVRLRREEAVAVQTENLPEALEAAELTREQGDAVLLTQRDRALLREVEHALAKFEAGGYGLSERSGQPIGFRRLEAVPWARTTADEAEPR
jgi:DnaK suppressor protein